MALGLLPFCFNTLKIIVGFYENQDDIVESLQQNDDHIWAGIEKQQYNECKPIKIFQTLFGDPIRQCENEICWWCYKKLIENF